MIGKKFKKTTTFTVTEFDEETGVVTGVNDRGAEIIMTVKQLAKIYTEVKAKKRIIKFQPRQCGKIWQNLANKP